MTQNKFSCWYSWSQREEIVGIEAPGVYVLASKAGLSTNTEFSWFKEIVYIGMTNASLKQRLRQFDNTIKGKLQHGGADRFLTGYKRNKKLFENLFVSVLLVPLGKIEFNSPEHLRLKGKVAKLEYDCLAEYAENHDKMLPEYNRKTSEKNSKSR